MRGPRRVHLRAQALGAQALRAQALGSMLALGAMALGALASPAEAQRTTFTPTLFWETGMIDTPTAWVSPLGSDFTLHISRSGRDSTALQAAGANSANYNVAVGASLWGRAEVGVSFFASSLQGGLFAKGILWDQFDGAFRTGLVHWLPSVAVGMRNVGNEDKSVNRWAHPETGDFQTSPTLYAVATRTFALGSGSERAARAKAQLTVNAGVGNGLFSDDAGLGSVYAKSATGGVFGGVKLDVTTSRFSNLALLLEHNGWDVNLGAVYELRGLRFGAYLLEAGAGSASPASMTYTKAAFSLGWQTNLLTLVRGNKMEARVNEIERERDLLISEIRAGQERVQGLEAQLRTVEGATEADRRAQRALLEQKLREEQEALRRLQERLNARKPQIGADGR